MKPTELHLFRSYGRPAVLPDGRVLSALSTPDLDSNSYRSALHLLRDGDDPLEFTHGPRDSAPVLSPDGSTVLFLRAGEAGPPQLHAMPVGGGEARPLTNATAHPLGVSAVTWSPDGRSIAYLAAVPEPGRYGTALAPATPGSAEHTEGAPKIGNTATPASGGPGAPKTRGDQDKPGPDAEAPRRITVMSYRADGRGFVLDKPEQIFLLDAAVALAGDAEPRRLTDEPGPIGRPAFTPDGRDVLYVRRVAPDVLHDEIAAVPTDAGEPTVGRSLVDTQGEAGGLATSGDSVYFVGSAYQGNDFAGQTQALWVAPLTGGAARRMTDEATVHVDAMAGEPVVTDGRVLVAVADRGAVSLRSVPLDATDLALGELPVLIGGRRVVKAFAVAGDRIAAVVAGPGSAGDIVTATLTPFGDEGAPVETALTDVSAPLRESGLATAQEITGTSPDGYPVHGWLVLPPEDRFPGPRPVLLDVHGGPHSAYTWAVFDEAQMYATHGYAVVLPNPRGSAGYGLQHGRAIVGKLGTVDADDVLALLDAALARDDCDASRVGVMGGSYGGFMTSWLASHAADRFVAGISERAVNAWDSFTGTSDIGFFFADGYVGSDRDEQWAKSPLAHADRIGIPLLIVHSEQDWRCPLEQGQRLFVALKQRGHETEMLVFPGEGHELSRSGRPRHRQQRFEAILDWWGRYLPVG